VHTPSRWAGCAGETLTPGTLLVASASILGVGLVFVVRAPRLWLLSTLLSSAAAFAAAAWVLHSAATFDYRPALAVGGESVHLHLDGLSALFLVLVSVVGGAGAVYGHEYWSDRGHPSSAPQGRVYWSVLLLTMGLLLLCANGLHFLMAWEGFAVSGYFLITLDRQRREAREAGWLYLASSHLGTLALFAFFASLAAQTGSWDLGPMRGRADLAPLFWLALLGFGVKAGLFPLHFWLPSAHASAPSHVSAILSGVAIKMGVYGIARFSGLLPAPTGAGWVVVGLGIASAVLGVAFALGQHDLKRLLAYHSVENVGIILIGLGFALVASTNGNPAWGELALVGALLHVWNHGLFKALLFLGAGSVLHATGTREMSRLGGLWRAMPWTTSLFALGAAAISGLPPLNGFVSELLVYLGLLDAVNAPGRPALGAVLALVLLAITGALALACFVKVCGVVFLGAPRSASASDARECGPWMRVPMVALAFGCVAIGLLPILFWPYLIAGASAWRGDRIAMPTPDFLTQLTRVHVLLAVSATAGVLLLWRRSQRNGRTLAPTWDCGYAAPAARMQYTAGSFAGIITEWFSWILLPERHDRRPRDIFPDQASYEEHASEAVLEHAVAPMSRAVMLFSEVARRLQHGRIQAYLVYVITGLVAVAALALLGNGR
jgi:hydrogenase-4 component B